MMKKIKAAKEAGESTDTFKEEIATLRRQQKANDVEIKQARKLNILHHRANKPVLDAQECIARYESYKAYMNILV